MNTFLYESEDAQRTDLFLVEHLPQLSRASIQKLCEQDKVLVNNKPVRASHKLKANDVMQIDYDLEDMGTIPTIKLPVLYEDDDCVVINKPFGLLTHSKGQFNPEATVATWLSPYLKELGGERGGIVHRLDRATSGVMICAKTPQALSWLQRQFSQRKVKKTYAAIISGVISPSEAIIDMPIERNPKAPATFRVGVNGKIAKTHYKVIKNNGRYSLIELMPETGRTHQLRVHLKQLGYPIVGDTLYDGEVAERLFLHAESLEITLPNHLRQVFTVALPIEFTDKVKRIS